MAVVVGVGTGVHSSLTQEDGGSPLHRVDLRRMLEKAADLRRDIVEGRWIIRTRQQRRHWEVIVEPDFAERLLIVITAYPSESEEK